MQAYGVTQHNDSYLNITHITMLANKIKTGIAKKTKGKAQ